MMTCMRTLFASLHWKNCVCIYCKVRPGFC